jgi:hypothetical protein
LQATTTRTSTALITTGYDCLKPGNPYKSISMSAVAPCADFKMLYAEATSQKIQIIQKTSACAHRSRLQGFLARQKCVSWCMTPNDKQCCQQ